MKIAIHVLRPWILICACCVLACSQALAADRPNVLLVTLMIVMTGGPLGGHPQTVTPTMDRLAAMGTTSPMPIVQRQFVGPSRASMLSGLDVNSTGVFAHINDQDLRQPPVLDKVIYLPEAMAAAGYATMGGVKYFIMVPGHKNERCFSNALVPPISARRRKSVLSGLVFRQTAPIEPKPIGACTRLGLQGRS